MSARVPHVANRLALVVAVPVLLAACEPTWQGTVPVSRQPAAPVAVQRPPSVTVYSGDTVYSIARRYSLSVRELIEANNLQPPYQLAPGTVLRLPGAGAEHVVQRGDTLLGLARRYKVDFNSLAATNNKKPPYVLYPGEHLRLPGAGGGEATAVASLQPTPQAQPQGQPQGQLGGPIVITSPNAAPQVRGRAVAGAAPPLIPLQPPLAAAPEPAPPQQPAPVHQAFAPDPAFPPAPPARAASSFLWPVKGDVVAEFGPLPAKGQHNDGINIAAPKGTPVRAAENGVVAYVGNELKGFGNLLLVKHADNWMTAYAHNDQLMVRRGDQVKRGQQIATVGATGSVATPQLHFEIRRGTEAVNPLDHLRDAMAMASR